MKDNKGLLI